MQGKLNEKVKRYPVSYPMFLLKPVKCSTAGHIPAPIKAIPDVNFILITTCNLSISLSGG